LSYVKGRDPHKNAEGYSDPTAYEAISKIMREEAKPDMFDSYIIARRQRLFPPGTKVRIVHMHDETMSHYNQKIAYVDFVDDIGYVFVKFRGAKKGLRLSGLDEFEKIV